MTHISVIIPAYNCIQTISRCMDSIIGQDYKDFEVLLIDDGSSDGTSDLCDVYALTDSRIRVFHKETGGVSSARNVGLENARGEWIAFVDSDDEMAERAIHHILNGISSQKVDSPDLIVENVCFFNNGQERGTLFSSALCSLDMLFKSGCWGAVWNKLFSNWVIKEHKIRFDESLHLSEDCLFVAEYCAYVHDVHYIDKVCYVQNLPDSYIVKYSRYNSFENNLDLYRKIKRVNQNCSFNLVDGLTMVLLRNISLHGSNASQYIADFKSAVGSDIQHTKGKRKCFIRALSRIDSVAVWTLVLKLHSHLPIW